MHKFIVLSALCFHCVASAGYLFYRDKTNTVMLHEEPCTGAVRENLNAEYRDKFQKATISIQGRPFKACWILRDDQRSIYILYEDGYDAIVPLSIFTEKPSV